MSNTIRSAFKKKTLEFSKCLKNKRISAVTVTRVEAFLLLVTWPRFPREYIGRMWPEIASTGCLAPLLNLGGGGTFWYWPENWLFWSFLVIFLSLDLVKGKVCCSRHKRHMGGVGVRLQSFWNATLDRSGQHHAQASSSPPGRNLVSHWTGGCVGPRAGPYYLEYRKITFRCRDSNPSPCSL